MASYNAAMPSTAHRPVFGGVPVPVIDPSAPAGTFAPGTKIQVGSHKVVIQKYFSEGGFAHVYLVKMPKAIDGTDIAVLKRVAVPDKEHLANMRTEVETMKKLKGHRAIVTYYDSHASQLKGGGYEVFLLMEFCNGGGLIDFMNTRLQNRLTEPEILKIFSDVAEGVACMHYLKPPLLHRDLKVENVLISASSSTKRFKLCDFGSTAPPRPAATTAAECRLIEDDVQKHTTLQYRSPEMVDVYRKQAIDEKSDIWALGVLLYKLCYYTTPFEAQGQLAILNASFKFPAYPPFSDPLKRLIASMLKEHPKSRPNIYQVLREACLMQGLEVPIRDIYAGRTQSEARKSQQLPATQTNIASPPAVGAVFSPPAQQKTVIPDVVPMRRGRPQATSQTPINKPSPSPLRGTSGDPFAALDAKSPPLASDELSSRFPSLDQFSLMHGGASFDFNAKSPTKAAAPEDLNQRITERLADDAFAVPAQKPPPPTITAAKPTTSIISKAQQIISSNPELQSPPPQNVVLQPSPTRIVNSSYVSHGTMTSQTPPAGAQSGRFGPSPVTRVNSNDLYRSESVPRTEDNTPNRSPWLRPQAPEQPTTLPPRQASLRPGHTRHVSSSRPSLEGGRPSQEVIDLARSRSNDIRPRPASTYLESNMDFLREKEKESSGRPSMSEKRHSSYSKESAVVTDDPEETNIASNVDFLKSLEDTDSSWKDRRKSSSSGHKSKRSSLPSLSGTKNLLAGRFGDAFKRFEHNAPPVPRTPSPLQDLERRDLTPIAGSEATDGRSDDGRLEDLDNADLAPEQRRELERRRLSMEEKRVANAAAEYRKRVAERGSAPPPRSIGGVSRATSIQNKVKSLLDENGQDSPPKPIKRTAAGYGRYTPEVSTQASAFRSQMSSSSVPPPLLSPSYPKPMRIPPQASNVARKPVVPSPGIIHARTLPNQQPEIDYSKPRAQVAPQASVHLPISASSPALSSRTGPSTSSRPSAPPKPVHLNSISTGPNSSLPLRPSSQQQNGNGEGSTFIPGVVQPRVQARPGMSGQEKEDYIADFSKRFPSLSGIEMVETRIEGGDTIESGGLKGREV